MKKIFVAIILAIITGNFSWAQNCTLILTGHVEDADSREKLEAATVTITELNKTVLTDKNGDFTFGQLCAGSYTITITHASCEPIQEKIELVRSRHIDFLLPHARQELGDVVVEANKGLQNTGMLKQLSGQRLKEAQGQSLADMLSKINGVTSLSTGPTVSKPVIHGLHSNRVLTINNGVRQEGQQWGNEHAPEIDPFIADKLTIIKGVDELKYGSDAIGGVVLVMPKALRFKEGVSGEANLGYFSGNNQWVGNAVIEHRLKRYPDFAYRVQGTLRKGANVKTPNYRLNNTAFEEASYSFTAALKKERYNIETFFSTYHTQNGIFSGSHIGNLSDLLNAIAQPRPAEVYTNERGYSIDRPSQQARHNLLKLKGDYLTGFGKLNLQVSMQFNKREEFDILRASTSKLPQLTLSVATYAEDLNWEHPSIGGLTGTIGLAAMQQNNWYNGRYLIPDYMSYTYGGYWIEKWQRNKWELQGGIRYDYKKVNTERFHFNGDTINHQFDYATLASSFNAGHKLNEHFKVNAAFSLSARAPHVNELLSNGVHHGTATFEIGDPALKPEKSLNTSIGLDYTSFNEKLRININAYNNHINNFIYQQPMPDDPVLTIRGAFPRFDYKQTDALLRGIDFSAEYTLWNRLSVHGQYALLRARNLKIHDWMIRMPSDRYTQRISYTFKNFKKIADAYVSAEVSHVLKQTRLPDEQIHGKQDYKAAEKGYTLVNIYAGAVVDTRFRPLTLGLTVKNLLNTSYRDYLNFFRYFGDEMGTNVNIRLQIPLTKN